jgi:hypothetical protein
LPHIPELVAPGIRWANEHGFPVSTFNPRDFTDQDKVNAERGIINQQIESETCIDAISGGFVADSAQLQQLMYLLYFCVERTTLEDAQSLYEIGMRHMLKYDVVFYIPQMLPIEDNGYRITNPLMLMAQDAILRRLMGEARRFGANIVSIGTADLQERLDYVERIVKTVGRRKTVPAFA